MYIMTKAEISIDFLNYFRFAQILGIEKSFLKSTEKWLFNDTRHKPREKPNKNFVLHGADLNVRI